MTTSAIALFGYIGWTLLLIILMEMFRAFLIFSGRWRVEHGFRPDGSDISPFAYRLARAHANCYEHFPIIGGLLILALLSGDTAVTDPLALWMLAARVAQSSTHLVSTSGPASFIRFSFFSLQLLIALWWVIRFCIHWTGG